MRSLLYLRASQKSSKMLEPVRYTTIGDICVTDLIFYDESKEGELEEYCRKYSIDYLPDRNRKTCWKLEGDSFKKLKEIPTELTCRPTDRIFNKLTIKNFNKYNPDEVRFVIENDLIKGVVHIVDYNNPDLYVELYRMLLHFEKNLREFLLKNNFGNEEVLKWIKEKADQFDGEGDNHFGNRWENVNTESAIRRRAYSNPLQTFYLRELIEFAIGKSLLDEKAVNPYYIGRLRNWIAHSQDVTATIQNDDGSIYDIDGLEIFVQRVKSFFKSYDVLEMKLEEITSAVYSSVPMDVEK